MLLPSVDVLKGYLYIATASCCLNLILRLFKNQSVLGLKPISVKLIMVSTSKYVGQQIVIHIHNKGIDELVRKLF